MRSLAAQQHHFTVHGENELFQASLSQTDLGNGIFLIHIQIESDTKEYPPVFSIEWSHPAVDIHSFWHPGTDRHKGFQVDWGEGFRSKNTSLAPVGCLYNLNGRNRLTFAFSDALNPVSVKAGIHEEDATFQCSITLFEEPMPKIKFYEATLRIDTRDIPYHESIKDVTTWWASLPGFQPAVVPEIATFPMYSTWYSFHQNLTAAGIEEQCRLAKSIGCEAVIVDDGWQTSDNHRKYAFCGDWQICADKIDDMKAHVQAVHQMNMKYILWYSVPFIGKQSEVWSKFEDKFLGVNEDLQAGILDPRFPEVREYLIHTYEQAVLDWDIDGLKLDFVDSFVLSEEKKLELGNGRDYESVSQAVDRLLTDVMARLRMIKPDILIEFRQSYIGPLMRKYGNMFRASDCPNDSIQNRVRTLDLRLLSGNTAVHSDMVMWHPDDPVESAALQILNILFSVPQISVLLNKIPQEHLEMLRFWLTFCRENRDVLLNGNLTPLHPELLYPLVKAANSDKQVIAAYSEMVIELDEKIPHQVILVNGTLTERILLKICKDIGARNIDVRNCLGHPVRSEQVHLNQGLYEFKVPKAGFIYISRDVMDEGL
jgi:alpha-galactosidase